MGDTAWLAGIAQYLNGQAWLLLQGIPLFSGTIEAYGNSAIVS